MKHISLFSGIGGFDLAAEWMGWENVAHCEWNHFGQKILKYYWPNAISYDDITKTDFTIHRGHIDILTGGFPCQPYSVAGKRKGKDDERHLWPEMLRAIREIQPSWVVGENVGGLLSWNGGMVFDEVQAELEAQGYEVLPFLLPAAGVNAPHKRDRIWFIAYSDNKRTGSGLGQVSETNGEISKRNNDAEFSNTNNRDAANSSFGGISGYWKSNDFSELSTAEPNQDNSNGRPRRMDWERFPTQPPVRDGNDGLSSRLDGITFPKWRNESIKGGGNAIVPQVAYQIFKAIKQYNLTNK